MQTNGRLFFYPSANSPSKGPISKISKVSRLKDMSHWQILHTMRDIVSEIKSTITLVGDDHPEALVKIIHLGQRLQNLDRELADRIKFMEYLASIDESLSEEESLRLSDEARPNRKSLAKVPNSPFNGHKKKGFDKKIPNPKNKIRFDRSKIRKSYQ